MPGRKMCPDCGEDKPHSEFGRNASRPDGLAFYCKPCFRLRSNAFYRNKRAAQGRTVRVKLDLPSDQKQCSGCREVKPLSEFHRHKTQSGGRNTYCKGCRAERQRQGYFQRTYGITVRELEAMIRAQGGVCCVCRRERPEHLDHCHLTGGVRGVLCTRCNLGLGSFLDDQATLRRAEQYVAYHQSMPALWPGPEQPPGTDARLASAVAPSD